MRNYLCTDPSLESTYGRQDGMERKPECVAFLHPRGPSPTKLGAHLWAEGGAA